MRMRFARTCGVILVFLSATCTAVAAQKPAASQLTLTPDQRAGLAVLGWPPPPPKIVRREDMVLQRASPPVFGSLKGLHEARREVRELRAGAPAGQCALHDHCRGSRNSASLKGTPQPPIPQYPFGFFARYCWW